MDAGECLNCTGEKMLHAIFAWGIGRAGQRRMRKKLGTWIRTTGFYIRRRRRRITRNIASWKLNVKCVSVGWRNVIGQDIWEVRSICWGAVVEKLVVMGGVGEDDTKGKARLPSTIYICVWKVLLAKKPPALMSNISLLCCSPDSMVKVPLVAPAVRHCNQWTKTECLPRRVHITETDQTNHLPVNLYRLEPSFVPRFRISKTLCAVLNGIFC